MALIKEKSVKNAVLFESDATKNIYLRVDNVCFSFPHVGAKHQVSPKDKPTWSCGAILAKSTHAEAKALIIEQCERLLAARGKNFKPPKKNWFLKNGDAEDQEREEFKGSWFFNAREPKKRPSARHIKRGLLNEDEADEVFYGGSEGSILIRIWGQDNEYGQRINAGLAGVAFVRDGEPFGEGPINDEDAFDDILDGNDGFEEVEEDDIPF